MLELSEQQIADLKSKHGELQQLDAGDVSVVVRRLTSAEFLKVQAMATSDNEQVKASSARTLLQMACVYPERPELEAMISHYPGLPDSLGGEVLRIAGAGLKVTAKKL